jgi:enoyl-CoA hydratase/carnithine racemase
MSERVTTHIEAHVAHVRLTRPEKRNGLDAAMFAALLEAGERVAANKAVRAVVLSGEGKAFCAGLDWNAFLAAEADVRSALLRRDGSSPANAAQRVCWIWAEVPVPVIAAVQGAAFGAGLQLALACDLRYATRDAQLSAMEIRYGLIPDMSITKTLPRLVRADVMKELVFTGRIVSGEEAASLGLVTRVCDDPLGEALAMAREIASKSPHAIRAGKRLLDTAPEMSVAAAFELETSLQLELLGSENQLEAVSAVLGKRDPVFRDP